VVRQPTALIRDAQSALECAQRAFERGHLKDAIELLEQALTMNVETVEIQTALGIAYARTYQVERAVDHLERAITLDPEGFAPRCALGELYLRLCTPDLARVELDRALECAATSTERAYVQELLKAERARNRRRLPRPSFARPFWRRRTKGPDT
jgi:Tfp pilus assembly protein PilF